MTSFQHAHALAPDGLYIERECDAALLERLVAGSHCHVLAPRQVGKSSLLMRTLRRLREAHADEIAAVRFTVTAIGTTTVTAEAWCAELKSVIAEGVSSPDAAVYPAPGTSPLAALRSALDRIVAAIAPRRLVLALDEVDAFHEMEFGYDLLQMLRARISDDDATPITLCFIGAMRPEEIIHAGEDLDRTPFQRMQKVFVRDFERAELGPFAAHLADLDECDPEAILDAVYAQTSGHPAMTQQLCRALEVEGLRDEPADVRVARVVEDEFFQLGNRDHLMRDVDGRFAKPDIARVGKMLSRYQVLLIEGGARLAAPDEEADAVLDGLRVAGLVTLTHDRWVRVRNPIFARAFDRAWVEQRLSARRPFAPEMSRWLQQRSKSLLLNGERLDEVIRWRAAHPELAPEETAFIDASLRESFRRRGRWFSTLVAIALVSGGVALGASVLYFESREAQTRAERAEEALRERAIQERERAQREQERREEAERELRLSEEGDRTHQALRRCDSDLRDAGTQVVALDAALVTANVRASEAAAQATALNASLVTANVRASEAAAQATALNASLSECRARVDVIDASVVACRRESLALATRANALVEELDRERSRSAALSDDLDDALSTARARRRDVAVLQSRLNAVATELEQRRAELRGLRAQYDVCRALARSPREMPPPLPSVAPGTIQTLPSLQLEP